MHVENSVIWGDIENKYFNISVPFTTVFPRSYWEASAALFTLFNGYVCHGLFKEGYSTIITQGQQINVPSDDNASLKWWIENLRSPYSQFTPPYSEYIAFIPNTIFEQIFVGTKDILVLDIVFNANRYLQTSNYLKKFNLSDRPSLHLAFSKIIETVDYKSGVKGVVEELNNFNEFKKANESILVQLGKPIRRCLLFRPSLLFNLASGNFNTEAYGEMDTITEEVAMIENGITAEMIQAEKKKLDEERARDIAAGKQKAFYFGNSDILHPSVYLEDDGSFVRLVEKYDLIHKLLDSEVMTFSKFVKDNLLQRHDADWLKIRDACIDFWLPHNNSIGVISFVSRARDELDRARKVLNISPPAALSHLASTVEFLAFGVLGKDPKYDNRMSMKTLILNNHAHPKLKDHYNLFLHILELRNRSSSAHATHIPASFREVEPLILVMETIIDNISKNRD
jgi:hypothetical protein